MNQILDEIKQDIKDEKYERLVTVHGKKIFTFILLIIALTIFTVSIKSFRESENISSGQVFYEAFSSGRIEDYEKVIETEHEGFSNIAKQIIAGIEISNDNFDEAIKNLEYVVKNADPVFSEYASLALLKVQLENGKIKFSEAEEKFEKLIKKGRAFRHSAIQLYVSFLIINKQNDKALKLINEVIEDDTAYDSLKKRFIELKSIIQA